MINDIRYGLRGLLKNPGFAGLTVIILSLAIGATTAIFTVVYGVLLRPLNYPEPDRLVVINEVNPQHSPEPFELSYLNWIDLRQQSKSFEEIAGVTFSPSILDAGGGPSRIVALGGSANLFTVLRARAAQGRTFVSDDDNPGANRVAVVSDKFWQRYFPNQSLNSQSINLDNHPYTVVGVMPGDFRFPDEKVDVCVNFGPDSGERFFQNRAIHFIFGLGRLKSGTTQQQALDELRTNFSVIQQHHPN